MLRLRNTLGCAGPLLLLAVSSAFATDVTLPNGNDWKRATGQERLAYVTGFSNALSLGYVSDEKHLPGNRETFTHRVAAGLSGTTIEKGVTLIDAWYNAHPAQLEKSVLEVLWDQAGKPDQLKSP